MNEFDGSPRSTLGDGGQIAEENLNAFPYMAAFLSECHRFCSMAPYVARVDKEKDLTINGYTIPAGTPILLANTVAMQDERVYENPQKCVLCYIGDCERKKH